MDINTKKMKKNAFRITKKRGLTASRVRVPGGHLPVQFLSVIQEIANTYGNGTVHITTRQGFEIPDIAFEHVDEVNRLLQQIIDGLHINQNDDHSGYPSAGTRNICGCIGNRVCPYGNYDTTGFAKKIEDHVFPNDLHFKIALTGCPNDCQKVRFHDFGIMGMTEPQYDSYKCVGCNACVDACTKKVTSALRMQNYKVTRSHDKCIGCGECVLACPTRAWTRSKEKYFRLTLMGRTGKKNPRLGEDFIIWADEDSILKIILNTYDYVNHFIDKGAPGGKEHIGYIVDRTGFQEYKQWAMKNVTLPEKAIVRENIYWTGVRYSI